MFVDFFWQPSFRQKELIAEIRENGTPLVGIVSFVTLMAMIGIFVLLLSLAFYMVYFLAFGWIESVLNTFKVINPNLFMLGVVGALFALYLYKVLIMFLIDRIGKDPVSFGVVMAAVGSFSIMDMYAVACLLIPIVGVIGAVTVEVFKIVYCCKWFGRCGVVKALVYYAISLLPIILFFTIV